MDSLALGVEIRVFTGLGLLRSEPSNGGTLGSGRVGDFDGNRLKYLFLDHVSGQKPGFKEKMTYRAFGDRFREDNSQSFAHNFNRLAELVLLPPRQFTSQLKKQASDSQQLLHPLQLC